MLDYMYNFHNIHFKSASWTTYYMFYSFKCLIDEGRN